MNRKQFLVLVVALLVLGGAGLAMFWQNIAAYRASVAKIGGPLLPGFKIADVARIRLKDAKSETTLAKKDNAWVVEERGGYPANFRALSDMTVKIAELKVTQSQTVGESLLPRLNLAEPGKGEGGGTLIEFKDKGGKTLASLLLGKVVLKKDPLNPLPSAQNGVPAGRYILVSGAKDRAIVVSDPLSFADAAPRKWLSKDFFKADRIKTLAVGPEGVAPHWKIARDVEWGEWKFVGGGKLDASAAVSAANALGDMTFVDVAPDAKAEDLRDATVATAETFDNLSYTLRIAKPKSGDNYYLRFTVSGEPPKERVPEKGEKPEDKVKRDKEFAETRKKLVERIAREQGLARWTYLVAAKSVEPLLKDRTQMTARKKK